MPIPKSKHTYTLLFHTISNCIELNIEIFGLSLNEKTFSSEEVTFYAVKTLRRSNNGTIFLTLIHPLLLVEKPYRTKFIFFATTSFLRYSFMLRGQNSFFFKSLKMSLVLCWSNLMIVWIYLGTFSQKTCQLKWPFLKNSASPNYNIHFASLYSNM